MQKTILSIKGLHCSSCKALIEDITKDFKGVRSAVVDVVRGTATVEHDEKFPVEQFRKEIDSLGQYRVVSIETR